MVLPFLSVKGVVEAYKILLQHHQEISSILTKAFDTTATEPQVNCNAQNLHFHLSRKCLLAKYPMFLRPDLKIDQDMYTYMTS